MEVQGLSEDTRMTLLEEHVQPDIKVHGTGLKPMLKTIPWTRVVIDTLLVAALVMASANFLTVR